MRVAVVQTRPRFGRVAANVDRALRQAASVRADLVVLPELFSTGYQFRSKAEVARLAEPVPDGLTARRLLEFADRRRCLVVAGLAERAGPRIYNSAVVAGPRGLVGLYRKVHLFGEEPRWFAPGNLGLTVWSVGRVRIGVMVCFDWFFPEAARVLALAGADLICHPANLVLPFCPEAMRTRSIENRLYTATANRVGTEARGGRTPLTYIGKSQITDPSGRLLYRAKAAGEAVGVVTITPRRARQKEIYPGSDLWTVRRPRVYRQICDA